MSQNYLNETQPVDNVQCPLRYLQSLLGGKWKLPIVCMLSNGTPLRNATIKRRLGNITNAMLSQTLKELESSGIIHREQFNEVPPHVEYTLTPRGKSIIESLMQIGAWATNDMHQACIEPACDKCASTC